MPELQDLAEKRAITLLSQIAHVKIETESIKDTVLEDSKNSTGNEKKRVKIHVKGVKAKESLPSDWRILCMNNYDFIHQKITSNKDS